MQPKIYSTEVVMRVARLMPVLSVLLAACGAEAETNHAPVLVPVVDQRIVIGGQLEAVLTATDPDQDAVTLALVEGPDGLTLTGATLAWNPDASDVGVHGVVVSATDDGDPALAVYMSFAVTVYDPTAPPPPNHSPLIIPLPVQTATVGDELVFFVMALDPDGDSLVWDALSVPPGATFNSATTTFSWVPTAADVGNRFTVLRVTDSGQPPLYALLLVDITVTADIPPTPTNLPPILWSVADPGLVEACTPFSASFEALDPEGTPIHYSSPNLPAGATLTPAGATVVLDWTPTSAQTGTHMVAIYATDEGSPPMSDALIYTIEVPALAPPVIQPIGDVLVAGGTPGSMEVSYPHEACYDVNVITMLPVFWDDESGTLTWPTEVEDFGIYAITFQLIDTSNPAISYTEVGRYVVQFVDEMTAFTGYGTRDVNLTWCCAGPVNYEVLPGTTDVLPGAGILHAWSDFATDVHGFAYRIFDRTEIPIAGVAYEMRSYDLVVGPACGSGGLFAFYDFVVDPPVTWQVWEDDTAATFLTNVPDGAFTLSSGVAPFPAPTGAASFALVQWDVSNICSVDVYYDYVILTPLEMLPTP